MKLNNKGFTLVEVLTVLVIISILGVVVVPNTIDVIKSSKENTYKILVKNIGISAVNLYKELEYSDSKLYYYNGDDKQILSISDDNEVKVNLSSLVRNGFLTGDNINEGKIINPINNSDIGECEIVITKNIDEDNNYNVNYVVESISTSNSLCPTTVEYSEGV